MIDWPIFMRDDYAFACRTIARLVPRRLRPAYDASDFVCAAILQLLFADDATPPLVVIVARRRMIDAARYPRGRLALPFLCNPPSKRPSVALDLDATELWERLLAKLDPFGREMVCWRLEGFSSREIAALSGNGLRTIERFFETYTEAHNEDRLRGPRRYVRRAARPDRPRGP